MTDTDLSALRGQPTPEELPPLPSWWGPLLWPVVTLLVVAVLVVAWKLARRTRRSSPVDPRTWALAELCRIDALRFPATEEAERKHTLLSDVVRRYLEMQYDLPASRQTTVEFWQTLQQSPVLDAALQPQLREFLERCDLAKFAPVELAAKDSLTLARRLVEVTAQGSKA